jgi:FkbM family methyltransferase
MSAAKKSAGSRLQAIVDSPAGRIVYKPFQKMLHYSRRLAHPDLPLDRAVLKVRCRGKKFALEVRRWGPDAIVVKQCFAGKQYDLPHCAHGAYLEEVYRQIVEGGKKPLIVDCGANIGASVLWFHARYPEAHIVAIEPALDNFALLEKNVRGLEMDLRQAAVGPECGEAWLSGQTGDTWGYRTNDRNEGVPVQVISLDRVLESKPPSLYVPFLLKVDIEGAEKSLFARNTQALHAFPLIVLEPHDWLLPGERTSQSFFRFHAEAGREFAMKDENVASIAYPAKELR